MNKKKEMSFVAITTLLCLALFLQRMTGEIWHVILGVLFIIVIIVHICRQIGRLKHMNSSIRLVDWMLLADLAVVFLSGILLHPLQGVFAIKILHKLSSVLLVIGMIVHVVQHKKK